MGSEMCIRDRHRGGALIHGFCQRTRRQVPDELAGFTDILHAVFPAAAGKTNDWRMVVKTVKETIGRQIALAAGALRADPANWARADDGIERIVRQTVSLRG